MKQETHFRSVVKALTWRFLATMTTIALVYLFTRDLVIAFELGAVEVLIKIVIYYLHERGWNALKWGLK